MSRYIVMTAAAHMPSSCWGRYGRVAVVETDGINRPSQINPRHKAVVRIVETWERQHVGSTDRCAFAKAVEAATELADRLNAETSDDSLTLDACSEADRELSLADIAA